MSPMKRKQAAMEYGAPKTSRRNELAALCRDLQGLMCPEKVGEPSYEDFRIYLQMMLNLVYGTMDVEDTRLVCTTIARIIAFLHARPNVDPYSVIRALLSQICAQLNRA